jgi:uncharacterized protein (DUF1499 family)
MKLIKFIAAAALVASTSLVSGGNVAAVGVTPQIAACTDWPFCRDVEIADETTELKHYIAACTDWPFCRDVEIADQAAGLQPQIQTQVVRKAA